MIDPQTTFIGSVELSRRLGVSVQTIRRWVKEGKLPPPVKLRPNFAVWHISVLDNAPRRPTSA